jgi:NAD(P)-dependent dehydrogenase (short-subunit alcohol dehydrogenase family)
MNLDLSGKVALVTGSTAGIGLAIATGLAEAHAHVWVNGRTSERVESAIASIRSAVPGAVVSPAPGDLATAEGAERVTRAVPSVDILVNNLGAVNVRKSFVDLTDDEWREMFEINVLSGVRITRAYVPQMRERGWGRIVFVSSESALQIPVEMIHYGVSKAANIVVARGLAETFVGSNVTVNSVIPGPTLAQGLTKRIAESGRAEAEYAEEFFRTVRPTSLTQRFASTEEVANLVVYLCSPPPPARMGRRCASKAVSSRTHSESVSLVSDQSLRAGRSPRHRPSP